jgi:hypothetical protein
MDRFDQSGAAQVEAVEALIERNAAFAEEGPEWPAARIGPRLKRSGMVRARTLESKTV